MRSLESCWVYLKSATGNQLIVAMAAGAYEIWPIDDERAQIYLTKTPERVIGVYSPATAYAELEADAEAQEEWTLN